MIELKTLILHHVRVNNGTTYTRLVMGIMGQTGPMRYTVQDYTRVIEELLRDKEIVRIQFIDPESGVSGTKPTLPKAVLFTKGTKFLNTIQETLKDDTTQKQSSHSKSRLANKGD